MWYTPLLQGEVLILWLYNAWGLYEVENGVVWQKQKCPKFCVPSFQMSARANTLLVNTNVMLTRRCQLILFHTLFTYVVNYQLSVVDFFKTIILKAP